MARKQTFTVVVMDDKEVNCRRIGQKIRGTRRVHFGDLEVSVTVKPVHIRVRREGRTNEPEADNWTFSEDIISDLVAAAAARPDMLIVDYIWIDDKMAAFYTKKAIERPVAKAEIQPYTLNADDLRKWVEKNSAIDGAKRSLILSGLFTFSGPLYLHTYTPQGLGLVTGSIVERERNASIAFPRAQLTVLDTRSEFFNSDEFDWPNGKPGFESNYYAYQLATYFDQVVQKEIFKRAFLESRFVRLQRTSFAVSLICAVGAGVGFSSGWAGGIVLEALRLGRLGEGIFLFLICMLTLLVAGFGLTMWFETLMRKLLREE